MIKFKINGSDIQVASSWDDLTFAQYLEILKPDNDMTSVICILTGFDRDYLNSAKIISLESLIAAANFLTQPPKYEPYYPQVGPYKLPYNNKEKQFDIRLESLGQFEDMRSAMAKIDGDIIRHTKAYGRYVAIYLQKIIDGEYKPSRVPEVEQEVQSYKACEVIALGQFFFLKLLLLSSGTQKTSPLTNQNQKKSKSDSTTSKRSSVPTRLSTGSRGK